MLEEPDMIAESERPDMIAELRKVKVGLWQRICLNVLLWWRRSACEYRGHKRLARYCPKCHLFV